MYLLFGKYVHIQQLTTNKDEDWLIMFNVAYAYFLRLVPSIYG